MKERYYAAEFYIRTDTKHRSYNIAEYTNTHQGNSLICEYFY